jgi:hypothetical protein
MVRLPVRTGKNQGDGRPGLAAPHRYPRYRLGFHKSPQRLSPFARHYIPKAHLPPRPSALDGCNLAQGRRTVRSTLRALGLD